MSVLNELQQKFCQIIKSSGVFSEEFYLTSNPDVRAAGVDALEHYIVAGEAEGRLPNPFFDPHWYFEQARSIPRNYNLLVHYLTIGDNERIQPFVGFDPEFVRSQAPARKEASLVTFLIARSFSKLINPNKYFDYAFYLKSNPDVAGADIDPYVHFVKVGADEGRMPSADFSWYYLRERFNLQGSNSEVFRQLMLNWRTLNWNALEGETSVALLQTEVRENHRPGPAYESLAPAVSVSQRRPCDVYAFYLPQFHRVAENDKWWGEGFTEWHNVVRGLPRFSGHYQPRVPALGFYDLDDPKVMRQQVDLAKHAGLSGFAFYYYNFGEKRLLERPIEAFRADKTLDIGYFLIWANETWSRRWDGSEAEILVEQTYPAKLMREMTEDLARHFEDPRYRRIDGRPLFVIYRAGALPEPKKFVAKLRAAFKRLGVNPIIYMAQTFDDQDPTPYGVDGAMEFPPHKHSARLKTIVPERMFETSANLRIYPYDGFVQTALDEPEVDYPLIRSCFPSWDNDGRRQGASSVVHDSTPEKFNQWLTHLVEIAERAPSQPNIVCINAWNEWGEGAYLEPDRRYGYAYLNTVQRVLHPEFRSQYGKVVLVGHDAFQGGAQRLLLNIGLTMKRFGVEVHFVLLRGDPGYDTLLPAYQEVAETSVVCGDADVHQILNGLRRRGFRHALLNSSVSADAIRPADAAGMRTILLVHELEKMFEGSGGAGIIRKFGKSVGNFIAPTSTIAAMLETQGNVAPAQIRVLPQGQYKTLGKIERRVAGKQLATQAGLKNKPRIVAGIGYADERKGIDLFLGACRQMAKRGDHTLFVWQGDWDPEARATHDLLIDELVASKHLLLLPNHETIEPTLGAGDVFFLSSREDPLPSVAFEAWSAGLPVVAFAGTGGIADLVAQNSQLGFLSKQMSARAAVGALEKALEVDTQGSVAMELRKQWVRENCHWGEYVARLLASLNGGAAVDVAIVGHNHGQFAESRVESIIHQTLKPASVTYVDVASKDAEKAKVAAAVSGALRKVTLVNSPSNHGKLHTTWLEIARASDAEFLHIAEGDDVVLPEFLERCISALVAQPTASFAFSAVSWIDQKGRTIVETHGNYVEELFGGALHPGGLVVGSEAANSDFMVKNAVLSMSSVVWRRQDLIAIIEAGLARLNECKFAFDWIVYAEAFRSGRDAVYVPSPLCGHRQHTRSFASHRDLAPHVQEMERFFKIYPASSARIKDAREKYISEVSRASPK